MIKSIRIGQVKVSNVSALVVRSDLDGSVLGMTFLNELSSFEFQGEDLIIRQ